MKRPFVEQLASNLRVDYDLTYKTQVSVATTAGKMLAWGLNRRQIAQVFEEIFENLAFVNKVPVILPGKGLIRVQVVIPEEKLAKGKR